jgi:hypothetical protein
MLFAVAAWYPVVESKAMAAVMYENFMIKGL